MSIRRGIKHLKDLTDAEYQALCTETINVTEKPDGQTFLIGYDTDGFYTQNSASSIYKMRTGQDYIIRAKHRNTKLHVAEAFSNFHSALERNKTFIEYLDYLTSDFGSIQLRCELFNKQLSKETEHPDYIKYCHIPYHRNIGGSIGAVIIYSQNTDNAVFNHSFLGSISNDELHFITDDLPQPTIATQYMTKSAFVDYIETSVIPHLPKKWGDFTEGYIFHTNVGPAFKVIDPAYKAFRSDGW